MQAAALLRNCPELLRAAGITVAFSGGLDSTVLLHLLWTLRNEGLLTAPLQAMHINHALHAEAASWEAHCRQVCAALGLPLRSETVAVCVAVGHSPEDAARKARHAAFASAIGQNELLLLAQHQDDQAETVLFRLLRGSGVAGLGGMPRLRGCGRGQLLRPLLDWPRRALRDYARHHDLTWVEDPSNTDQRHDRNYLRAAIVPALGSRWPGMRSTLGRSARLCAEAAQLLRVLANQDLALARGELPGRLACAPLREFDPVRQRNLLHCWLQELHEQQGFAAPSHQVLEELVTTVLPADRSANPSLRWGTGDGLATLHRYQDHLYVLPPLPARMDGGPWHTVSAYELPPPLGRLYLETVQGPGLPRDRVEHLQLRFRRGGELVKVAGRPTRPLKKFLQDCGIPPWLRDHVPLFYAGEELVAVADLAICEGWLDKTGQNCCRIRWQRSRAHCGW